LARTIPRSERGDGAGRRPPHFMDFTQDRIFDSDDAENKVVSRTYRIPRYRVALVREGSVTVARKRIGSPQDVCDLARKVLGDADREYFLVVLLDTKNNVTGVNVVSIGCLNSSLVHPREVFKAAILHNAASIVLCHNHPSGDAIASREDLEITKRLVEAGKIIGIEVLDHVIVGDGYTSLKEKGEI
jgi:DNA repair protein RadC